MTDRSQAIDALTRLRVDPYADIAADLQSHAEETGCGLVVPGLAAARAEAVLADAARATYVLVAGDESIYPAFHIVSTFGLTGRIDLLVSDPAHAKIAEDAVTRHARAENMRVHIGQAADLVPSFNGPFDMIVFGPGLADLEPRYEDVVRLVRTGGAVLLRAPDLPSLDPGEGETRTVAVARTVARRLATDNRLTVSFGLMRDAIVAVRAR